MSGLAEVLSFIEKNPNIADMKIIKKGKNFLKINCFLIFCFLILFLNFFSNEKNKS